MRVGFHHNRYSYTHISARHCALLTNETLRKTGYRMRNEQHYKGGLIGVTPMDFLFAEAEDTVGGGSYGNHMTLVRRG